MPTKTDIKDRDDIVVFVDAFYEKVRDDKLLSPIFDSKIASNEWVEHLNRMYDFWYAMIFYHDRYEGNPLAKHIRLPIGPDHFEQWLTLFNQTIDENFAGPTAEEVKQRAAQIAVAFERKIDEFHSLS